MKKLLIITIVAAALVLLLLGCAWYLYDSGGNVLVLHSIDAEHPVFARMDNLRIPYRADFVGGNCEIRSRDELMPIIAELVRGFDDVELDEVYVTSRNLAIGLIMAAVVVIAVWAVVRYRISRKTL